MAKLLLILALFLAVVMADPECDQGVSSNQGCLCYSGYITDGFGNCTINVASIYDCYVPAADPLTTGVVLEFLTSETYISENALTLTVASAPIQGRYFSSVGVGSCQFPATYVEWWGKTFNFGTCKDNYQTNITVFELNTSCGFDVTSDQSNTYITGDVNAIAVDPLPSMRGVEISRSTSASLLFELTLPKVITLTSQALTILSPIDLQAAVTGQGYDRSSDVGTFTLTTSVQYPWALEDIYLSGETSLPTSFWLSDNTGCPDDGASDCFQTWTVEVSQIVNSSSCFLEGDFSFQFGFTCQPTFNQSNGCPVTESNTTTITASISSEDLCGSVSIVSNIAGTLTAKALFYNPNDVITLDYVITADVDITSVDITSVCVTQESCFEIYNGTEVDPSVMFFSSNDNNAGQFGFNLVTDVLPNFFIFDASGGQDVFSFYVELDVMVTYDTYHLTRKREALSSKITLKKELVMDFSKARVEVAELLAPNAAPSAAAFTAGTVLATAATAGLLALF